MMYFLFAVLFILLLLYLMPIVISIAINKDNENDKITIGLRTLYGLIKLKTEIPFLIITFENGRPALKYKMEVANKKRSRLLARFTKLFSIRDGEKLYEVYKSIKDKIIPVLKYISRKIKISKFNFKLSMGTGDAAATGVLYGAAWIVIGNVMTLTRSYLNVNNSRIVIVPIFSRVQLCIDFSCIISLKLGHIINAGIRAIPVLFSGIRK